MAAQWARTVLLVVQAAVVLVVLFQTLVVQELQIKVMQAALEILAQVWTAQAVAAARVQLVKLVAAVAAMAAMVVLVFQLKFQVHH
jgi:predicted RNA methylase